MLKPFLSLLLIGAGLMFTHAQSYQLTGQVTDEKGSPVPFASIYLQGGAHIGTSANSEGVFKLGLPAGSHELIVRSVGYRQTTRMVTMDRDKQLDITLAAESYLLDEVVIGNGEDPAYAIIRQAIRHRRAHLNDAVPYTANVYIKGVQRLLQAPKKFLGVDIDELGRELGLDSNRTGIVYLSESESHITVQPPDDFREEMVSSTFSGNNRAFSFNRAADLKLNFYENNQPIIDGLSPRPFISPIADNALGYYRYRLLGTTEENGLTIHKIEVSPRRRGEPLYRGDIYIADSLWRIYGVNLQLTKSAGINIIDTLAIRQEFIPIGSGQWQPSSIRFDFVGGLLGFRVGGYFAAVYSDYATHPTIAKGAFNEVLRIAEGVNKRDSAYWATHRPLLLTEEERLDYIRKDSLQRRRESKPYLDSVDRIANRLKPQDLLTGYTYRNRAARSSLSFNGLATSLLFNSVEGLALNYGMRYSRRVDTVQNRNFTVYGNIRYGFANKRLNGYAGTSFPLGKSFVNVYGGSDVQDMNNRGSLLPLFNTISTTFFGRNYLKLYERTFGTLEWRYTLPANIIVSASALWENRLWLPNSTNYTFWNRNERHLTSNNPFDPAADAGPLFPEHQAVKVSLGLSYDFGTKYETYPHRRVYLPSPWPTLSLSYTKGIPKLLGSDVDYDLLMARLHKTDIGLGLYGRMAFDIRAGKFLNEKVLYYTDYRHFNGTRTLVSDQQLSTFLLLDNYRHSTSGSFVEAHGEYNLSTLLTGKVPLLRKLRLHEIIGLHYLHTPAIRHYGEVHAGLEWQRLRVIYARSVGSQAAPGRKEAIRIGLRLF